MITQTSSSLVSADNYMSSYAIHCTTLKLMELNGFQFEYLFDTEEEENKYKDSYNNAYKNMHLRFEVEAMFFILVLIRKFKSNFKIQLIENLHLIAKYRRMESIVCKVPEFALIIKLAI